MEFLRVYGRVIGLLRAERNLAIALAFVAAFYLAGLSNQVVFGRWWLVTPEEVTLRIYDFTVISLAMLSQLYRRGHYIRRLAFWTGFADLMKVCLGGMLLDTFMQFLLRSEEHTSELQSH